MGGGANWLSSSERSSYPTDHFQIVFVPGIINYCDKIVFEMTVPIYVDALLPKDTHSVYLSFLNTAIHHALQDKLSPITLKRELERIFTNLFLSNHFIDVWNHLEEGVLLDLIKEHKRKSGYEDADNLEEECEDVMTSVVPLEEPVQMSLRLLSLRDPPSEVYLGKGEGVSLDMLASKKVITSQVDRGKLERTLLGRRGGLRRGQEMWCQHRNLVKSIQQLQLKSYSMHQCWKQCL